ncbi:copper resistance D family protein [Niallia endozanthoxylica]|uniref:Copper resistance protein CopD n=1 Tax=Niallia endozanthoxylica TaxID=2036016 RepID=A0A5J5I0K6_9BACI|nr:CopD family protein [Niallia endozanthoxylica]KAA9028453.1 copper resistance protein CopD [Niallia endozanthoxylica]
MILLGTLTQALLYLSFAIVVGTFILSLVSSNFKPDISVPKWVLLSAIGGIGLFSFFPVLQLILYVKQNIGLSFSLLQSVLFTFEVGKAWVVTYLLATVLFLYIIWVDYRKKPVYASIGLVFAFCLILALGWSSHASTYDPVVGFMSHTLHLTAVSVWVGILLIVSWCSTNYENWSRFLKWFTPVAIICFLSTIITGLVLMTFVVEFEDYLNSWMLPYGQTLLIKHLLIIPLLVYAMINSFFVKKKLNNDEQYNPRPWGKLESLVILFIFAATAAMGQHAPPHETIVTVEGASKLFTTFYPDFQPGMAVQLGFTSVSILLLVLTVLSSVLLIILFIRKTPVIVSILTSVLLFICAYLSVMFSIN